MTNLESDSAIARSQANRIPPTIDVRRCRQKVSGVVTPSPVGPAIENERTPSPPRPRPAGLGPLIDEDRCSPSACPSSTSPSCRASGGPPCGRSRAPTPSPARSPGRRSATRTNGMNGIICSWSTNGCSAPVSPKRICVPFGTSTPAYLPRTAGSWPTRSLLTCSLPSSPLTNAAFVSASIWPALSRKPPRAADLFHQLVEDLGDGEDLLLADAEQVVVERRPLDDRLRRVRRGRPSRRRRPAGCPARRRPPAACSRAPRGRRRGRR